MRSSLCVLFACLLGSVLCDKPPLRFNADGKFRIVQFTDLHFGEGFDKDVKSMALMENILNWEKPDFVVMTGDSVSGYAYPGHQPGWFALQYANVTAPMVKANIPWGYTLGNHDRQADLTDRQCIEEDMKYPLSYSTVSPEGVTGGSNFWVDIHHADSDDVGARLLFLDSGEETCEGVKGWGCAYPDQVEWYRETSQQWRAAHNKTVPVAAYFHIPLPEYRKLWNSFYVNGTCDDNGVACFSVNTGVYAAFKEAQEVVIASCGHDHLNDFIGMYYGTFLAYGRKTGYGSYFSDTHIRGARVLELQPDKMTFDTWIRQRDGTVMKVQPQHSPGSPQYGLCKGTIGTGESNCDVFVKQFRREHGFI